MKIVKQMMIIGTITFIGKLLNIFLPFPIPGSVYGTVLLLVCLLTGVVKLKDVEDTADFLVSIMPLMFIAPCLSLMDSLPVVADSVPAIVLICVVSTITTMVITGLVTQFVMRWKEGRQKK